MVTQSIDTHPAVEELQLSLLRQATLARRFAIFTRPNLPVLIQEIEELLKKMGREQ